MLRFRVRGINSSKGMRPWTRGLGQRCSRGRSASGAGCTFNDCIGRPWRSVALLKVAAARRACRAGTELANAMTVDSALADTLCAAQVFYAEGDL